MLRRPLAVLLVGAGAALLARAVGELGSQPQRSAAVILLGSLGMFISGVAAGARQLPVRGWVRALSAAAGGVLIVGLLATRYYVGRHVVPDVPVKDVTLRDALADWEATLGWLAAASGYIVLAVAVLPGRQRRAPPEDAAGSVSSGSDPGG